MPFSIFKVTRHDHSLPHKQEIHLPGRASFSPRNGLSEGMLYGALLSLKSTSTRSTLPRSVDLLNVTTRQKRKTVVTEWFNRKCLFNARKARSDLFCSSVWMNLSREYSSGHFKIHPATSISSHMNNGQQWSESTGCHNTDHQCGIV